VTAGLFVVLSSYGNRPQILKNVETAASKSPTHSNIWEKILYSKAVEYMTLAFNVHSSSLCLVSYFFIFVLAISLLKMGWVFENEMVSCEETVSKVSQ